MVVTIMTILTTSDIYNMVIWIIESCSRGQSQISFMTSFVVVNIVVNAMFWHCASSIICEYVLTIFSFSMFTLGSSLVFRTLNVFPFQPSLVSHFVFCTQKKDNMSKLRRNKCLTYVQLIFKLI
jgi:hypothetical protein